MIILIRIVLLYLILGLAYSEYRRYKISKYSSYEEIFTILNKKRFVILSFVFNPVIVAKLKFDLWRLNRYLK